MEKSTEKKFLTVAEVFGKFPKIDCGVMKSTDLPSYSAIVGALAKDNRASIDIPLALTPNGKELFNVGKITRVFWAVSEFYEKKIQLAIDEKTGLNGDSYFVIHVSRVPAIVKLPTREPDKCEIKQESSKKRAEKASENKLKKENEITAQVEERAQAVAKKQLEEQVNFLAQKINKAINARFKQWNIAISDDKMKMLQNDIVAIIQNS